MGLLNHLFPIIAFVLYLSACVLYLGGFFSQREIFDKKISIMLLSFGFVSQIASIGLRAGINFQVSKGAFGVSGLEPSFASTLYLISCFVVGLFLVLRRRFSIEPLGAFVSPLAVLFLLASGILFHFERTGIAPAPRGSLLWFHISTTLLGHVAFVFAFGVSLALIIQETLIKKKKSFKLQKKLPAVIVLDSLNALILSMGFVLMVCGVLSGVIFALSQSMDLLTADNRLFWSLVTLTVYAVLLFGRSFKGLRGKRAAWYSVAGFCTVLASFLSMAVMGSGFHAH
jgi:ABC-type uncharacterized transport system permease subunit